MTGSALIGLLEPPAAIAGGGISLDGERIDTLKAERLRQLRGRRIGSVFQDPQTSLHPLFSVGKQLEDTIRAHLPVTAAEARRRAIALMREVGIARPETSDRRLSPPVLRRDAPAHRHRAGARRRTTLRHCR